MNEMLWYRMAVGVCAHASIEIATTRWLQAKKAVVSCETLFVPFLTVRRLDIKSVLLKSYCLFQLNLKLAGFRHDMK